MTKACQRRFALRACAAGLGRIALIAASLVGGAQAQDLFTFSVDWHGPANGTPGFGGVIEITEGDILMPPFGFPDFGPLPPPQIFLTGAEMGLPLYGICDSTPGNPCRIEVDAFSDGNDSILKNLPGLPYNIYFSTDEYAVGFGVGPTASILSEAPFGDISADVFVSLQTNPGPIPPSTIAPAIPNTLGFDGNGEASSAPVPAVAPGLGIREPNIPFTGLPNQPFDFGDNLDALNINTNLTQARVFFSLDGGLFDTKAGVNNSNSAQQNFNLSAGDILMRNLGGGAPTVYADHALLGLSALDDIDALILHENGDNLYQPSLVPYDWEGGTTDMLIFSVRRSSPIIGQLDSIQGVPIMPGDLLVPPLFGPDPGTTPGLLIPGESLGLSTGRLGGEFDDIDALDVEDDPPYHDCNDNGIDDSVDIANGGSCDDNMNGIPDECEPPGTGYCFCTTGQGPCSNDYTNGGCENSTGSGAILEGTGSSSVFQDDLVLTITQAPTGQFGLLYMGSNQISAPFGDGLRCVGAGAGGTHRFGVQSSRGAGTYTEGPGIISDACANFPPAGCILLGATWNFQGWYRDPGGPCANAHNLSNAWSVTFTQ
ncbi:MAG: hypothetical protein ACI835_000825 [Planctomycetota bacterium]|jgi:hypothetical protein